MKLSFWLWFFLLLWANTLSIPLLISHESSGSDSDYSFVLLTATQLTPAGVLQSVWPDPSESIWPSVLSQFPSLLHFLILFLPLVSGLLFFQVPWSFLHVSYLLLFRPPLNGGLSQAPPFRSAVLILHSIGARCLPNKRTNIGLKPNLATD